MKKILSLLLFVLLFAAWGKETGTSVAVASEHFVAVEEKLAVVPEEMVMPAAALVLNQDFSDLSSMMLYGKEEQVEVKGGRLYLATVNPADTATGQMGILLKDDLTIPENEALEITFTIDPLVNEDSGADMDAGFCIDVQDVYKGPNRFAGGKSSIIVEFKESAAADRARFSILRDGKDIAFWGRPREKDYGLPNIMHKLDGYYSAKVVMIPRGDETGFQFYIEHMDRPLKMYNYDTKQWVLEWRIPRRLEEFSVGFYTRQGGLDNKTGISGFGPVTVRRVPVPSATEWMNSADFVMANINYDHPAMTEVKAAKEAGDMGLAKELLLHYFRERTGPVGPEINPAFSRARDHGKEANWKEVADNACNGIYSKLSWFHGFSKPGELSRENGMPRWDRDPGFLNRHFHWAALTYAWQRTHDPKYAKRLSDEVIDYVETEPTVWYKNPNLGGQLDVLDGSVLAEDMLWSGNVGRRLELIWWQVFEVMRRYPEFTDDAMFHFLDSVIRQCRLLTNPSICKIWDDSGFHGAMALVKSSMLFPMADEAPVWSEIGWDRINRIVDVQFHPDGSHVSLSTGYNWATISGFEEFFEYLHLNHYSVPEKIKERVKEMYFHPLYLTRPDFGSIDLNDGGWGRIEHSLEHAMEWFPEYKEQYLFYHTLGKEGKAPDPVSMYFPNAGQYLMRTGWGEGEQYLFFDAGPWGASHGKQDGLNIYAAYGDQLLIRNAGRGAYSGVGNTVHAGKSLSYNTLSPDWGEQNRIPLWEHEKWVGFNPPKRRWVSNDDFDYGEGFYEYGWHVPEEKDDRDKVVRAGEHVQGKQTRQVVFIKGEDPKKTGYYVVFDSVVPENKEKEYTWRHPWQLEPNDIRILSRDKSTLAESVKAAVRIIPVDPDRNIDVEIIKGQPKPHLLGWRVNGESAVPWPVPTYSWKTSGTFSKAWIIMMQGPEQNWPVDEVKVLKSKPGEVLFRIKREDGGTDYIARRMPGAEPTKMARQDVEGDVAVVRLSRTGKLVAKLDVKED